MPKLSAVSAAKIETLATILKTTVKNLPNRVIRMRLGPVCSRCLGTGNYSYCAMHGTRCFGCGGFGNMMPSRPADIDATLAAAQKAAADGTLDKYLRAMRAEKSFDRLMKEVFATWQATKVAQNNPSHMIRSEDVEGLAELRAANRIMANAQQAASDARYSLKAKSPTYADDVLAIEKVFLGAIETIKAADYDVPPLAIPDLKIGW